MQQMKLLYRRTVLLYYHTEKMLLDNNKKVTHTYREKIPLSFVLLFIIIITK